MKNYTKYIVIGVVVFFLLSAVGTYNSMTSKEVAVDTAASQIDVQLQRRSELIPQLVGTVKGYATHEKDTLTRVTEARAKLANAKTMTEKNEANNQLTTALYSLQPLQEKYPDLKADKQFTELMRELTGTQNRVTVARTRYNKSVQDYNTSTRQFPTNIVANFCGFQQKDLLEATKEEKANPEVNF